MNADQTAAISARILIKYAELGSLKLAYDAVFGEGVYDKFIGDLYLALNIKAAAAATKN